MLTIIETPLFKRDADAVWSEDERGEFCAWLAVRPDVGDVIKGTGGCRKVRWSRKGTGKRGGVRVIYFNKPAEHEIWLLVIYAKSVRGDIPLHLLRAIREELIDE
jgi:hypothetical protein